MNDDTHFLGQNLSFETYDELAFKMIRADWRGIETELFTTKWFDYRFMHPTKATYLFAHHYEIAWRAACRANFDVAQAATSKVFPSSNLFLCPKQTVSGIWRGRQKADGLGMPYEVYLRFAFEEVLRFWRQKNMPRPQQLYSDDLIARVMARWDEAQRAKLYVGKHPAYQAANNQGLECQADHVVWLVKQAHKRIDAPSIIERFRREGLLAEIPRAAA